MSKRPLLRDLADIEALEAVPFAEREGHDSTYELFAASAARVPDEPALIWLPNGRANDEASIWTHRELYEQITRTANFLNSVGVRPGRPLSFLLPNLPETHFTLWGGSAAGEVNPVNPLLAPSQIAEIIAAAGSRTLVTAAPDVDADLWNKADAARALLPELETVIVIGDTTPAGTINFREGVANHLADRLTTGRKIRPDDIATYFHTGGTTGAPKLAQQTHRNQVAMAWIMAHAVDCGPGDVFLTGLPLFHANAAILSGLTAFAAGSATILAGPAGFRSKPALADFWQTVERFQVTHFSAVPTILASLLDTPRNGADPASLRVCVCGAAPLAVSLFREFEDTTGLRILEAYGMTEGTLASTINPRDGERRIGSVGIRLPYHRIKTAILDADGNHVRDANDDEAGVLLLNGETVTPGYKQDDYNRGLWPLPGWLNTGDLARRDADGYFWLTGRAKDLIIRGGHNIDPAVIEEALYSHPAVELAAAVGRPDPYAGEIPVAFVSLRPGAIAEESELLDHARAHVPERPAAPGFVRILDKIPTTAVGKIFKPALREIVVREAIGKALAPLDDGFVVTASTSKQRGLVVTVDLAQSHVTRAIVEARLARYPVTVDIIVREVA